MKRTELLRRLEVGARAADVTLELARRGKKHDIYQIGGERFSVARHKETSDGVVRQIDRQLEAVLGKRWWER